MIVRMTISYFGGRIVRKAIFMQFTFPSYKGGLFVRIVRILIWDNSENSRCCTPKVEFQMLDSPLAFGLLEWWELTSQMACLVQGISDKELSFLEIYNMM